MSVYIYIYIYIYILVKEADTRQDYGGDEENYIEQAWHRGELGIQENV